jgi:MerR family transcriptional regulator/heat shock protein HspR
VSQSADSGGAGRRVRKVTRVSAELDRERGVFMISVAAELAEMHPQTLRMYESRGLITPKRSPKNTRLYSQEDVERLRRIQEMTAEQGLNLAGVETVLHLEDRLEQMRAEVARMRERAAEMERQMTAEIERARRSIGAEMVPYRAYESPAIEGPAAESGQGGPSATADSGSVSIPIRRRKTS